jgi:hypothetical protein
VNIVEVADRTDQIIGPPRVKVIKRTIEQEWSMAVLRRLVAGCFTSIPGWGHWSLYEVRGRQSGAGAHSSPTTVVSPIRIVLPVLHIHSHFTWGCMMGPPHVAVRCTQSHIDTGE